MTEEDIAAWVEPLTRPNVLAQPIENLKLFIESDFQKIGVETIGQLIRCSQDTILKIEKRGTPGFNWSRL